ncbi:MAG: tyrosine-type recombinase/integrase [Betaproteobacteria bacterium]|nr:tyrosine-type recombinase/integrase [Betaproteobacteria bacterium]
MARELNKLTDPAIRAAKPPPPEKKSTRYINDGGGLYLQISPSGARGWIFRFPKEGKTKGGKSKTCEMGLGAYPDRPLADEKKKIKNEDTGKVETVVVVKGARTLAAEYREMLSNGINPIVARLERKATKAAKDQKMITFGEAVEACVKDYEDAGKWRGLKTAKLFRSALKKYCGALWGLPVHAIDRHAHIVPCFKPSWASKHTMMARTRLHAATVFEWAIAHKRMTGPNPAAWDREMAILLPSPDVVEGEQQKPSLPYTLIHDFMTSLREREGYAARALELVVLTGCRNGEVVGAKWNEIDMKAGTWTLGARRTKQGKRNVVMLSKQALKMLAALPRMAGSDYVFPNTRGDALSGNAVSQTMAQMNADDGGKWVDPDKGKPAMVHGFRSTMRSWAQDARTVDREVVEAMLGHTMGNKVERTYARGSMEDARRVATQLWSDFIDTAPATGKVVTMKRRKA